MRILVLIAIGLLLYVIVNNMLRKRRNNTMESNIDQMVQCSHCGLHILQQESVKSAGKFYCSVEHELAEK